MVEAIQTVATGAVGQGGNQFFVGNADSRRPHSLVEGGLFA